MSRPTSSEREGEPTTLALTNNRDLAKRMPLFDMCTGLAFICLAAAIGANEVRVVALAAPFIVAVAISLALWSPVDGSVKVEMSPRRLIEGESVEITVEIRSERGLGRVEVEIEIDKRLEHTSSLRAVARVRPGEATVVTFPVTGVAWGVAEMTHLRLRVTDRLGMFGGHIDIVPKQSVRIGLPEDRIKSALDADRFRRIVGSHLSNDRGQGLEIADIRPFQPGDSSRQINWRISNRRGEPWVTLRHPDRSTTVVVIVDAHDGDDAEQLATQRRSVAAAMALSRGHLAMHDRVGLLVVGHTLRWLPPKLGRHQLYGIADELTAIGNAPEASRRMYRPPAVGSIPNNAIVIAISPLRDPLMVALVAEIRLRGNPVSVLVPTSSEPTVSRRPIGRRVDDAARRLAAVEQEIGVQSLRQRGVAILAWEPDEPVTAVMESIGRLRNSLARARSTA